MAAFSALVLGPRFFPGYGSFLGLGGGLSFFGSLLGRTGMGFLGSMKSSGTSSAAPAAIAARAFSALDFGPRFLPE